MIVIVLSADLFSQTVIDVDMNCAGVANVVEAILSA